MERGEDVLMFGVYVRGKRGAGRVCGRPFSCARLCRIGSYQNGVISPQCGQVLVARLRGSFMSFLQ